LLAVVEEPLPSLEKAKIIAPILTAWGFYLAIMNFQVAKMR
jgi:hypothetical protein